MKILLFLFSFLLVACGIDDEVIVVEGAPRHLSWASIDTDGDGAVENYVTSIKRQPCADCFIYSPVGLLEIQYQIDHGMYVSLNLSEQSLHNCLRISCSASGDDRFILNYLRKYGVMEETYAKTGAWGTCNNCRSHVQNGIGPIPIESVPFFTFTDYRTVVTGDMSHEDRKRALVNALQDGPAAIHVYGWRGFKKIGNNLYCVEEAGGQHAIVVIGYREFGKSFIVKNSGGTELLYVAYEGSEKCGFARHATQISPGTTYASWGWGEHFCYSKNDMDGDTIPDVHDNCPWIKNKNQENDDQDMFGDECDSCPHDKDEETGFYCQLEKEEE